MTGLAAARDENDDIAVTWSAPDSPGSGVFAAYDYRLSTDGGTTWNPDWTETTAGASHTFTPAADTGYTVAVRVRNSFTQGGSSQDVLGAAAQIGPPNAPTDLELAPRTEPADDDQGFPMYDNDGNRLYEGVFGVSWSAPDDASGITGYLVQYRAAATADACSDSDHTTQSACELHHGASATWTPAVAAGAWDNAEWSAGDGLAADIDGLTVDTAYDVRVAAVSALGVSEFSEKTATPSLELRAPSEPRNVQVFPAAGGLRVTWEPPLDLGNPIFETYVFEIRPTDGWNCATKPTDDPDHVFTVWTVRRRR